NTTCYLAAKMLLGIRKRLYVCPHVVGQCDERVWREQVNPADRQRSSSAGHIPTKQKRRSTGQGAKNPLDPQRPEKGSVLWHLRPRAFAPQASVMTSSVQDDVATSIPVSCDGVKTHVFMDDSIEFSGGVGHCSSKASRREDLEIEQPVACWDCSSFHFHPTLASMLGATLIRYQVVEVR